MEIVITGERDETPPWPYRSIHLLYRVSGKDIKASAVSQAIALSEEKYCSVAATVRGVAAITTDFELISTDTDAKS